MDEMRRYVPETFLDGWVDSEEARKALFHAGTILLDEVKYALMEYLQEDNDYLFKDYIPPAFQHCLTPNLAVKMHGAAVALITNLCAGRPAGCVAEEIMAVHLIDEAQMWLELYELSGSEDLRGIFELFQDDDVLFIFNMKEPADANVARESLVNQQLGVVDQTIDSWFNAFGGVYPTGIYNEEDLAED